RGAQYGAWRSPGADDVVDERAQPPRLRSSVEIATRLRKGDLAELRATGVIEREQGFDPMLARLRAQVSAAGLEAGAARAQGGGDAAATARRRFHRFHRRAAAEE